MDIEDKLAAENRIVAIRLGLINNYLTKPLTKPPETTDDKLSNRLKKKLEDTQCNIL